MAYKINVYVDPDRAVRRKHRPRIILAEDTELSLCDRMRTAVQVCMRRGLIAPESTSKRRGVGSALATHFGVTRQRISQIVKEERLALQQRD